MGVRPFPKLFTVLIILFGISGCGQQNSINNGADLSAMKIRFATGDAVMACNISCAGNYGFNRMALHNLYATQDWNDLTDKLLTIGNDSDQSWFYLASAAEGLGFATAAQRYYFISLTSRFRCKNLVNVCDGLDLPALTIDRLNDLDAKLLTTPQFSQLSSTPATSSLQAQIHLTSTDGILMAPVLLDGKVPLLFGIDSGSTGVNIPAGVAVLLIKDGVLRKTDVIGGVISVMADGDRVPLIIFRIKTLQVGNIVVRNIIGSISDGSGQLLLGQSFLNTFKSWSIDNAQQTLVLQR